MSDDIAITLKEREVIRKGLTGLRTQGQVPAVIHNHGKESMHVMGDAVALEKAYQKAGRHHPVSLKIGSKQRLALIKDVDFDPTKHKMRHIVFQAIRQNETTTAEIPVVLVGEEIPAEKKNLLILTQYDTVDVEALPKDLPDELTADATVLADVGDRVHVSDIKAPQGVTILTDPDLTLAVVEMPRDQVAEADAAAESLAEDQGVPDEEPAEEPDDTEKDEEPSDESEVSKEA
ncbi:MAG: 50S ribosomal protein L25 [Candidatus Saccharibacteria bacterium]|nr:50S ribosomal protein L25 [Candidatus Saccharibacteria bacterium]